MRHMALALMLIAAPALGATRTDTTVAFYHGDPDRAGNYIVPGLNWQSVGAVRRDQTFDGHVDGHIYAQPLYWHPSGSERGLIIAPTEDDLVYALDAETGKELFNSGDTLASFTHFGGIAVSNGRVFVTTWDGYVYAFGLKNEER